MMVSSLTRKLALWLCVGAALISVALATATYVFEIGRVDHAILDLAAGEARTFRAMHTEMFRRAATPASEEVIGAQLGRFLETREANAEGHFIAAELYDVSRHLLADAVQDSGVTVEAALSAREHRFPEDGKPWYDKLTVDGRLYMRVLVPLRDPVDSRPLGFFEGVYHVSEARIASIRERLVTNVLLVIGVVLCTTIFLVPVILAVSRDLMSLSRRLMRANLETLEVLGNAIAKRDSDTGAHNYRVTVFAIRLAEAVNLPPARMRELIKGAFLHDVGKIGITDAILLKPGRLTPEEFAEMRQHVAHGVDIVSRASWLSDATDVVRFHHEKFDGAGYLEGLKGDEIPITARIFAIADVFDALISRRPYKEPKPFDQALAIVEEGAGGHFDPELVAVFRRIARPLYDSYAGRDDDGLERCLAELTDRYFQVAKG